MAGSMTTAPPGACQRGRWKTSCVVMVSWLAAGIGRGGSGSPAPAGIPGRSPRTQPGPAARRDHHRTGRTTPPAGQPVHGPAAGNMMNRRQREPALWSTSVSRGRLRGSRACGEAPAWPAAGPGSRSRCGRPVMSDIQLCVMQGYPPGAHHRVKLVLYLVLRVGDLPGLHPEVGHVIAAA